MTDWKTSEELKEAFPDVTINMRPVGDLICCQIKMPREKMGSILLTDDTKELHRWETMVAKVVKIGPVAFRDASELEGGIVNLIKKAINWLLPIINWLLRLFLLTKWQLKPYNTLLKEWPEGAWANIGDYVVIPKYGSVRFTVAVPGRSTKCIFAFLRCKDIRTVIEGNPLEVDEYV